MIQKQGSTTGTVSDTYASVLSIPDFQNYEKIVIHIKNTNGAALTLDYKILAYAKNGGDLRLVGLKGKAEEVFKLAGLRDMFSVYDTHESAFEDF